ncbi:MAG: hypothetical protein KDK89_14725 [Alphaproteobacteria bacterium]|nr:hypothetical protein [Alphaproteobacteria bacterium]
MIVRVACSLLALVLVAGAMPGDAQADHRKRIRRAPVYEDYGGPQFVRAPLRFIFGGYELTPEDYADLYGNDDFDEGYYDPTIDLAPPKAKSKSKTAAKIPDKIVPKPVAKPKSVRDLSTASVSKPAKTESSSDSSRSTAGLSCEKAGQIITGYGFTGVKAQACEGKVYAFNATRDGKPFAIKLNAANGELTEVKKLQ